MSQSAESVEHMTAWLLVRVCA